MSLDQTPSVIAAPARLAVLGGGQLGRFFVRAAQELGYEVWVLDPDPEAPAGRIAERHLIAPYDDADALREIAQHCAAATTEFENVPAPALAWLAQHIPVRPNAAAVAVAQDRREEKGFFVANGFPCVSYAVIVRAEDLEVVPQVCFPGILKTARLGYDGKGQRSVETRDALAQAWQELGQVPCVLEARVALAAELSVIVVRAASGETVAYAPGWNVHRHGILDVTLAPAPLPSAVCAEAQRLAQAMARALDYVGVLGVEFFLTDDGRLLVNELAPRPHNSGHHTIDACAVSQFEQQVRALCGLPLGATTQHSAAVMVNLLGDLWFADGQRREPDWGRILALPQVALHLYGKREARAGRKMGHATVLASKREDAWSVAKVLRQHLGLPPAPEMPLAAKEQG